ncbi:tripartite tricarboxylate transporter TctB family protein [Paracoccus liaowanqingii]|uniref:Tripartite tricarboxylate transporter TctB family protein n=1 Tax=Paracoccus liaowanqingii TaxID=2560053 RepID=A0A4Z1CTN2_9RHOB|nr:tripartite tricarboxylate transporter TctB family protein [Paracoccus liaowanqingii]TGN68731.1 tripartite tricarboxylate transporter TctB family protein [Paracoccus liaowanqingii]
MEPTPKRRPGELVFNIVIMLASFGLLYSAYGISGFEALSAPGAVPMATTAIMGVCAVLILRDTLRKDGDTTQTLAAHILPLIVIVTIAMIAAYALLLRPLGFLPTSVLFLLVMVRFLSKRSLAFCLAVSVGTVLLIWIIFRLIFAVLMPQGIIPEGRIVSAITSLF